MKTFALILSVLCLLILPIQAADLSATFAPQIPVNPTVFDAPTTSSYACEIDVNPLVVKWRTPTAGVNSATGLLVILPGKSSFGDCVRDFDVQDATWPDAKNVIVCNIFYRNDTFSPPYDFGKFQLTDVMRGLGTLLEQYPQLDRRRLYLYGASGGALLALQTLQVSRHLWSEVYIHCAPTELGMFVQQPGGAPPQGKNGLPFYTTLVFPGTGAKMTGHDSDRYEAERALRSPRENIALDLPSPGSTDFPRIYCMQGTNDAAINISHLYDLRDTVKNVLGITVSPVTVTGGQRWNYRQWSFIAIANADHTYQGANATVNSFIKATNHYVPAALTTQRPTAPALSVNYAHPWRLGWRFVIDGALTAATISTEAATSVGDAWRIYE